MTRFPIMHIGSYAFEKEKIWTTTCGPYRSITTTAMYQAAVETGKKAQTFLRHFDTL